MMPDYVQTPPKCCALCGGTLTTKAGFLGFYLGNISPTSYGCYCIACWGRHGKKGQYFENLMEKEEPTLPSSLDADAAYNEWQKAWFNLYGADVNLITNDDNKLIMHINCGSLPYVMRGLPFRILSMNFPPDRSFKEVPKDYVACKIELNRTMFDDKIPALCMIVKGVFGDVFLWDTSRQTFTRRNV